MIQQNQQNQWKSTEISDILTKLNMKSIDQMIQLDTISIQKIAHRSRIHTELVEKYLDRLHQLILDTQLLAKKNVMEPCKEPIIQLQEVFPEIQFNIEEGELIEIIGRANAGKTFLMVEIIKLAIKNGLRPIILCSGCHQSQYRQKIAQNQMMLFNFENLCDLAMLIHSIGNHIIESGSKKYLLLIDCLSYIELEDESIEFGGSQKFRRLISTFTNRTQISIVYSYRVGSSLFRTQYKKQHYRPKCKNSKQWDGWSSKSIFMDHIVRKKDLKIIMRINFPKSLNNKLHEIVI